MTGDRLRAIGNAAIGHKSRAHPFRSFREEPASDEPVLISNDTSSSQHFVHTDDATDQELTGPDSTLQVYGWPPLYPPENDDVVAALGANVPFEEIMDPVDRSRVVYAQIQRLDDESDQLFDGLRKSAVNERWRRRQFYTDEEEGMGRPPGYTEPESSDDEVSERDEPSGGVLKSKGSSRRPSLRSRSSSKVRFDDSAIDTDYETRSDVSSRSIPVNERWGGFELGQPERDIGRDIIYQTVQQGFNELLDPMFKHKEDEAMEALSTQASRERWASLLDDYEKRQTTASAAHNTTSGAAENIDETTNVSTSPQHDFENQRTAEEDHIGIMFCKSLNESLDSIPDPTLPQNRPNESWAMNHVEIEEPITPPSETTLALWLKHKAIDEQAKERGGYGRLNFQELRRKMRAEMDDSLHESNNKEFADDDQYWEASTDLGKLSFLSTWLEMGQI